MSVEVRPVGVTCNIQCQYCYQNPQRDAGNVARSYDLVAMKAAIEREGSAFTLFGGEPLMVPEPDLEDLWSWGFERFGGNSLQTNGSLINDNHIRMFKQYRVYVGISIDGPGELNDIRWAGSLGRTREATAKTETAIARLCAEGIPPSLIVTLHRGNATPDKLPAMHDWLREIEALGVASARLHILEVDHDLVGQKYALSPAENLEAFLSFAALERELATLRLDVFQDMRSLLMGDDNSTTCVWNGCDTYATQAVHGIEGSGQSSNCGRTNKDGIDFTKSSTPGFERYLALFQTPQEHGGCKGCRFFLMCKGQCPGTAIDGDWRNRTEHCDVWKGLYRHLEDEMLDHDLVPLSVRPDRHVIEARFMARWAEGQNTTIASVLHELAGAGSGGATTSAGPDQAHGDEPHGDSWHGDEAHGDLPHGDAPHGDA